mmetsp:Transcript_79162/g.220051  ORF Transcript_79162/g.220051 Transcript_79162/m.220051 type:complete len:222 (+) Transcript_79162:956-1621(+)
MEVRGVRIYARGAADVAAPPRGRGRGHVIGGHETATLRRWRVLCAGLRIVEFTRQSAATLARLRRRTGAVAGAALDVQQWCTQLRGALLIRLALLHERHRQERDEHQEAAEVAEPQLALEGLHAEEPKPPDDVANDEVDEVVEREAQAETEQLHERQHQVVGKPPKAAAEDNEQAEALAQFAEHQGDQNPDHQDPVAHEPLEGRSVERLIALGGRILDPEG